MDRYKEGYNDCELKWKEKIKKIIYYNEENYIDGYNYGSSYGDLLDELEELIK